MRSIRNTLLCLLPAAGLWACDAEEEEGDPVEGEGEEAEAEEAGAEAEAEAEAEEAEAEAEGEEAEADGEESEAEGEESESEGEEAESEGEEAESEGEGDLRWYFTCGDPVCRGYDPPPGVRRCQEESAGDACAVEGDTCDPASECNSLLVCARSDPTMGGAGCPISRKRHKRDIAYLTPPEVERLHDAVVRMPLARWRYRAEGAAAPERVGFLIDDVAGGPAAPAVRPDGERVDLYGYVSMAVAALQAQDRRIQAMQAEVRALREGCAAGGRAGQGHPGRACRAGRP